MIRVCALALVLALAAVTSACGTTTPPRCQPSNCSGCCTAANECIGPMRQTQALCGAGGAECRPCLPDQLCTPAGRCVLDPNANGGGSSGGGTAGGATGGGMATCGGEGESCCEGSTCGQGLSCSRNLCLRCGLTNQPCCGAFCQNSNVCSGGVCVFPSTGGGAAGGGGNGGGTAGGGGGTGGGGTAGGGAGGATGGGGAALLSIGDPCTLPSECARPPGGGPARCLIAGFDLGYCSADCTSDSNCPF
ncbi:MAG: hypothetical protein INH37_14540, partial [Myxococcaceae bacterium]|nr:hypothetical protein [Myxococcaceae bacterium]